MRFNRSSDEKQNRPVRSPGVSLIGIGLDCEDGHKRVTQAEQFSVLGGSEKTHETMTEVLIKTCEDLEKRGKTLRAAEMSELCDILNKHVQNCR